ncbi:MAG TPA: hypothetical protein DHV42_00200 [Lachnospiraceae bacterium]|nr:hypothetical protein [Lachnospiraceae bacterium]
MNFSTGAFRENVPWRLRLSGCGCRHTDRQKCGIRRNRILNLGGTASQKTRPGDETGTGFFHCESAQHVKEKRGIV